MKYLLIVGVVGYMLQTAPEMGTQFTRQKTIADTTKTGYVVFSKSENINSIAFKKLKSKKNTMYFTIGTKKTDINNEHSTAYGIGGVSHSEEAKKAIGPTIKDIKLFKGKYEDMIPEKISDTQTGYTFKNVTYPINLTVTIAGEKASFEIAEPGNWAVEINLKK